MTKKELALHVAQATNVSQEIAEKVIDGTNAVIKSALADGKSVFIRGFGTYLPKFRHEKVARNISTGQSIIVPEHKVPFFKPCPEFKEQVAG